MTVLIDSCRLYKKMRYHARPIKVIIKCMHSWNTYEQLKSPVAAKGYFSTG